MLRDPVTNARIWVGSRARTMPVAGMVQRGRPRTGKIAALREHAANAMPGKASRRNGNQAGCGFSIITAHPSHRQPSHCEPSPHAMAVTHLHSERWAIQWGVYSGCSAMAESLINYIGSTIEMPHCRLAIDLRRKR